jgi:hypothetical protein
MIIEQPIYNGDLIHKRFAYQFFKKEVSPYGNVVAFRAPMYVSDNLIDLEDSLSKDFIFSDDAINFCWEIPNMCPKGAVAFQRLFNTQIANVLSLEFLKKPIEVKGDDLMVVDEFNGSDNKLRDKGKCSVSITYSKDNVAIGHTGINVSAGRKAPPFAYSTNLSDEDATKFMNNVVQIFYSINDEIFIASSKVDF